MFFIRAMGCDYHHDRDFRIEREHGYDCYLALYLKSRSRLPEEGELVSCDENTFILFNQNSPHRYGADNEEYIEDWIQFECGSAFLTRLNLPFDKPVHIGGQVRLDRYFALIRDVFFRCINDSEHRGGCRRCRRFPDDAPLQGADAAKTQDTRRALA